MVTTKTSKRHRDPSAACHQTDDYNDVEIKYMPFSLRPHLFNNLKFKKMSETRHVVPNADGGWDSKKGGAERASKHFETKKECEDYSRDLSRKEKSELVIHGKDGKIQRKDSHGGDKFPPAG